MRITILQVGTKSVTTIEQVCHAGNNPLHDNIGVVSVQEKSITISCTNCRQSMTQTYAE